MRCTVFYSWQSQLPSSTNRSFIGEALKKAAKAVADDVTIDARPEIDRDTANVPGSPNIADTTRAKIDAAEIVVCDVSIVQGLDGDGELVRPVPNPNVLIELGYAMRALGTTDRLVLVMNTAFGGIDKLPFDLRQYRPTHYCLREDAPDKATERKKLIAAFEATFRHVLQRPSRHSAPVSASPLDELVKAIESGTPHVELRVKRFADQLVASLLERAPIPTGDFDRDYERLVEALGATTESVCAFARLADALSGVNATACAHALYDGLAPLVGRFDIARGYSGNVRRYDFDYFKFITHELLVIFTARVIAHERWGMLDEVLRRELYASYGTGQRALPFYELSQPVELLDAHTDRARMRPGPSRASEHADLLKERHTTGELGQLVPMSDLVGADVMLFIRSEVIQPATPAGCYWFPRSAPFIDHQLPAYLVKGENVAYGLGLLKAFGSESFQNFRSAVAQQSPSWGRFFGGMPTPPLTILRLEKLGTRS